MAKPSTGKPSNKVEFVVEEVKPEADAAVVTVKPPLDKPEVNVPVASSAKKELPPVRPKKPSPSTTKSGSLLPSAYKLEHLKAAVAAAGTAEKLLLILNHVEEAGGKSEVADSIEAYRVLKTVLEE